MKFRRYEAFRGKIGVVLFSINWGIICFVVSVLLGVSYLVRKGLKKNWMKVHRILTVCLLVFLVLHVAVVGGELEKDDTELPVKGHHGPVGHGEKRRRHRYGNN